MTNRSTRTCKNLKKKMLSFVIVCMTGILFFAVPSWAAPDSKSIDVIILLDVSGSMRASDRSRNALEATKMFIDMIGTQGSKVGVLAFNDSIVDDISLTEINSLADTEALKEKIDSFQYDGHTDIGMPLTKAVQTLTDQFDDNSTPMILLLTDGNIDMDPSSARTYDDSYNDIMSAVGQAGKNIPIYTIGLNYNQDVDSALLDTVAQQTGGRSYLVDSADSLPQIFNEIFADHIKSVLIPVDNFTSDGNYKDIGIDISNEFVSEANIIILSDQQLVDAKLSTPDGTSVPLNQGNVSFAQSQKYSMIKIISPQKGAWTLSVKGVAESNVKVNLIYQYNVGLNIAVNQPNASGGVFDPASPITVEGQYIVNGQPTADMSLYQNSTAQLVISDDNGNVLKTLDMPFVDDSFSLLYQPDSDTNIKMSVTTSGADFSRQSDQVDIQFPQAQAAAPATAQPTEQPTAMPTVAPTPVVTPAVTPESVPAPKIGMVYIVIIIVLVILLLITLLILLRYRKNLHKFFNGYMEVRAVSGSGIYSALEVPSLSTFLYKINLADFLQTGLTSETNAKILQLGLDIMNISLTPSVSDNEYVLILKNNSNCVIETDYGFTLDQKKIVWRSGHKLIIRKADQADAAKIEATYMTEN